VLDSRRQQQPAWPLAVLDSRRQQQPAWPLAVLALFKEGKINGTCI